MTDHERIIARRLAGQRLVGKGLKRAADVVREQCAVQSQDYAGAKWAVAMRSTGLTDADVEAEFNTGAILRTHVMRPTWHFVAPEDLRWMLTLTGPRVNKIMDHYGATLGLSDAIYRRSNAIIEKALAGGKFLTRQELYEALKVGGIKVVNGMALARLVMRAETDLVIVSGPRRGKQFTYALVEERVAPAPPKSRDEALGEITRRYFETRSPATVRDCAWWSGLTVADVKRGIQVAGKALTRELIDDREYWSHSRRSVQAAASRAATSVTSVRLLPNYDEYFIGFKDRSSIGHRIGSIKRVTGGNALIAYVVCVDGELVGGWKRTGNGAVTLTFDLMTTLTSAERKRLDAEVRRFGDFLGRTVTVRKR